MSKKYPKKFKLTLWIKNAGLKEKAAPEPNFPAEEAKLHSEPQDHAPVGTGELS